MCANCMLCIQAKKNMASNLNDLILEDYFVLSFMLIFTCHGLSIVLTIHCSIEIFHVETVFIVLFFDAVMLDMVEGQSFHI